MSDLHSIIEKELHEPEDLYWCSRGYHTYMNNYKENYGPGMYNNKTGWLYYWDTTDTACKKYICRYCSHQTNDLNDHYKGGE